jgi:hypothetical protein
MIYSILIYRDTKIIHFEELNRISLDPHSLVSLSPKANAESTQYNHLMIGMLSAITGIVSMLSSADSNVKFESMLTPEYRLDYYETLTGYKFVVLSNAGNPAPIAAVRSEFERLYSVFFVPLVIRNPLFDPKVLSGNLNDSNCQAFVAELRSHFQCFDQVSASTTPPVTPPATLNSYPGTFQSSLI